jgi:hypothetical protein
VAELIPDGLLSIHEFCDPARNKGVDSQSICHALVLICPVPQARIMLCTTQLGCVTNDQRKLFSTRASTGIIENGSPVKVLEMGAFNFTVNANSSN